MTRSVAFSPLSFTCGLLVASTLLLSPPAAQGPAGASVVDLGGGCTSGVCGFPVLSGSFGTGPSGFPGIYLCADGGFDLSARTLFLLVVGASTTSIDLSALSPGCVLLVSPHALLPTEGVPGSCAGATGCGFAGGCTDCGRAAWLGVPSDPALVGASAFAQGVHVFMTAGSSLGLALSNALAITLS